MAELNTLGPRAALDLLQSFAGVDLARVWNFQNRQGLTGQQILTQTFAAVGGINQALVNRYGALAYITTDDKVLYAQGEGVRTKTPKKVEFAVNDSVRRSETGHMLPLTDYEDYLSWGMLWLRDAKQSNVDNDLTLMTERWQNRVEDDIWTRALTNTENPQGAGFDVGWAMGTGNVPYIPTPYSSVTFNSSHTHYLWQAGNTSANAQTLIENMVKDMRHHGHEGRLQAFVSENDADIYAGMSKFVALQPAGFSIVPGNGSVAVQVAQGEQTGMPGELFGYVNTSRGVVELRYYPRIPTGYIFMTKSYGVNNPNNGLAVRLHPDIAFGLTPKIILERSNTPEMEMIKLSATHGIGVNKRLNGVAGYWATGAAAYVNPSLS